MRAFNAAPPKTFFSFLLFFFFSFVNFAHHPVQKDESDEVLSEKRSKTPKKVCSI
jgi:hypothetical protein